MTGDPVDNRPAGIAGVGPRRTVAVVGGGISGLAAAARLAAERADLQVIVLEAGPRVGGKLRRVEVGGAWIDVGAESLLAMRPEGLAVVDAAGLTGAVIHPQTTAALLRNRGHNRSLPARTLMGIPSDVEAARSAAVLSEPTLARIAAEPEDAPPLADDISVGDLVAQRFGDEVVQRLVDPLLGGVYAGQAHGISVQAAMPTLFNRLADKGGSLREAAAANVAAGAREPEPGRPARPVFASLTGGLARLPETLAAGLDVRTNSAVRAVSRTPTGFRLELGSVAEARALEVDGLILATPAGKTASLLAELAPVAAGELTGIVTASMAIVTLAFAGAIQLPPGSGVLIPHVEGLASKAMTFSSQKWPGVGAEAGVTLLRASLGRAGDERTLQQEDGALVAAVRAELAELTGVDDVPVEAHVQRWGGALPQYAVGHVDRVARIRHAVAGVAGLAVCGATYQGVGIPACIATAHTAADQVSKALAASAQ